MSVKWLGLLGLLLIPQAKADVLVNLDACELKIAIPQMERTQSDASQPVRQSAPLLNGELKVQFTDGAVVIPELTFTGQAPEETSRLMIEWQNTDLVYNDGRPIFNQSFQTQIEREQVLPFALEQQSSGQYSSSFWGFARSQVFFALMHSQSSFVLKALNQETKALALVEVPLTGSDVAFRKLAKACYSGRASDYLEGVNRLKGVGESWQKSYGVLDYSEIDQLSRSLFERNWQVNPLAIPATQINSYLQMLKSLEQAAAESLQDGDTLTQADALLLRLSQTQGLISESLEPSLMQIKNQKQDFETQITQINRQLSELQKEWQPLSKQLQLETSEFDRLTAELLVIRQEVFSAEDEIEKIQSGLQKLSGLQGDSLFQNFVDWNEAEEFSKAVSLDEVLNLYESLKLNHHQQGLYRGLEILMGLLQAHLSALNQVKQEVSAQLNQLLSLKQRSLSLKGDYSEKAELVSILNDQFHGLSQAVLQDRLKQEFDGNWQQALTSDDLINQVRAAHQQYDQVLERANQEFRRPQFLSGILCNTETLKREFVGDCLDPRDMDDPKAWEEFLHGQDSDRLEELSRQFNQRLPDFDGETLSEDLAFEWEIALSLIPVEDLKHTWESILYARWKFFTARDLGFGSLTAQRLRDHLGQTQAEIAKLQGEMTELQKQEESLQGELSELRQAYQGQEQRYFQATANTNNKVQTLLSLDENNIPEGDLDCFEKDDPLLECLPQVEEQRQAYQNNQIELAQQFTTLATELSRHFKTAWSQHWLHLDQQEERRDKAQANVESFIEDQQMLSRDQSIGDLSQRQQQIEQTLQGLEEDEAKQLEQQRQLLDLEIGKRKSLALAQVQEAELAMELQSYKDQLDQNCTVSQSLRQSFDRLADDLHRDFKVTPHRPSWYLSLARRCSLTELQTGQD